MHTIVNNVELGLLEITVSGFWDMSDLDAFAIDLVQAISAFPDIGRPPASLYDFTDVAIQTQEVVSRMQAMTTAPAFAGRRVALYTNGGLARMQARRIAQAGQHMQVFDSRADALAWLADAD